MNVIKSCSDCKIREGKIETCHRIEHIVALSEIAKEPRKPTRKQLKAAVVRACRPEPSFALTHKTCPDIPEGAVEKVWVASYLTYVSIHGHSHDCEWKVSRAGKDYCLVKSCRT